MNFIYQKYYFILTITIIFGIFISYVNGTDCDIFSNVVSYFGKDYMETFDNLSNCCEIKGITCNTQKNIIEIKLNKIENYSLESQTVKAYEELTKLKYLTTLELTNVTTDYGMGIPSCIGNLTSLETLVLSNNGYDYRGSPIPEEIGNLKNLIKLDLSSNRFIGSIPKSFCNLKNLKELNLYFNDLNGTFPYDCKNLVNLEYLNLEGNTDIDGYVPILPNLISCNYKATNLCDLPESICKSSNNSYICTSEDIIKSNNKNGNPNPTSDQYEGKGSFKTISTMPSNSAYLSNGGSSGSKDSALTVDENDAISFGVKLIIGLSIIIIILMGISTFYLEKNKKEKQKLHKHYTIKNGYKILLNNNENFSSSSPITNSKTNNKLSSSHNTKNNIPILTLTPATIPRNIENNDKKQDYNFTSNVPNENNNDNYFNYGSPTTTTTYTVNNIS